MLTARTLCLVLMCLAATVSAAAQTPAASTQAAVEPKVSFAEAARTVMASIQKNCYDQRTGLYFKSQEKREPEFMWGNGVMFSALAAAARNEPGTYRPIMDRFFSAMDRYWDSKAPVPGYEPAPTRGNGHDKYYDDNQWMVISFMEAYDLTRDAKYLDRARETLKFSLSGWDETLGGGIWWHEKHKGDGKNTCANAPAAVGCLRVGRFREREEKVLWARKIVAWTTEHLQDKDALFFDNKHATDGKVDQRKFTYNSALMIRANLGLYRETKDAKFLAEAKRIDAACASFVNPKTDAYRDSPKFTHLLVEADLELHRATGDSEILLRARRNGDAAWAKWKSSPPKDLIEQASIARMLWLLSDQESEAGRAFWTKADAPIAGEP